jgi:hypothetical protein
MPHPAVSKGLPKVVKQVLKRLSLKSNADFVDFASQNQQNRRFKNVTRLCENTFAAKEYFLERRFRWHNTDETASKKYYLAA